MAGRAVCLLDPELSAEMGSEIEQRLGLGTRITAGPEGLRIESLESAAPPPPDVVVFKVTSGTTARPEVVPFTAGQILADCDQVCTTMQISADDLNFGVIAFTHSYGFSSLITPLLCRGVPLVAATDGLPRAVWSAVWNTGATVLPLVPAMFGALRSVESLPNTVRLCISAGAPLDPVLAGDFFSRFSRKIHSFYGASECGGICYDSTDRPIADAGFVGTPLDGVAIEWLDDPTPSGARILVRSRAVGSPDDNGPGTFSPTDLLVPSDAGFRIVGREADLINCGGRKVAPAGIEAVIARCPGIRDVVVFGSPRPNGGEAVHALIVADQPPSPAAIRLHCAGKLPPWQIPREFHFVASVPRNARGKISRRDLAAAYG
jgi:long-chain acyl-CoA synthetase